MEYYSDDGESETETLSEKQITQIVKKKEVQLPTEQPAAAANPNAFPVQPYASLSDKNSEDSTEN
jgi:hypothetical protein